ncbi:MAG: radical SAM protein [Nanoarchaeota archaeon]
MLEVEVIASNYYTNKKGPRAWKTHIPNLPDNMLPAYLNALTPNDANVKIKTSDLHNPSYDPSIDLAVISFGTANAPIAYHVAEKYRNQGTKVIFGGVHINSINNIGLLSEAQQFADSVCITEADQVWSRILEDTVSGELKQIYHSSLADIKQTPILTPNDRSLLRKPSISSPFVSIRTSEGCPYKCNFCSIYKIFGANYRFRNIEDVIEEIKLIKPITSFYGTKRYVSFTDDNLLGKMTRGLTLLEEIASLGNVAWVGGISSDLINEKSVKTLAKSGAIAIFMGFDKFSGNDLAGKNRARFGEKIELLHKYNIGVEGAVIIGHDSDTPETLRNIEEFFIQNKIDVPSVNLLTAYPGTDLWDEITEQDRLKFPVKGEGEDWKFWARYTTEEVNIKEHPHFTDDELFESYIKLWKALVSGSSIRNRFKNRIIHPMILPNIMYNAFLHDGLPQTVIRAAIKSNSILPKLL